MKTELLIIDPQIDFCDPQGSLFVAGADKDMERLATFITNNGKNINNIHVTMDSHHLLDVAHPIFWRNSKGENPDPFTIINSQDVKDGTWQPVFPKLIKKMINYVESLEASGRYPLCIWPPHCLIGSKGHGVYPALFEVLSKWEERPWAVDYVTKGSNIYTEHYSAVRAEVPDPSDPSTQLNANKLIQTLMEADNVLVAGEAGSHCLANTVRDIVEGFGDDDLVKKIVLLNDATSPVTSFENLQEDFIAEMTAKGMQISNTVDYCNVLV